ncbi:AbpD bacteriocin export accessory protein [Ligilactobacillus salivarius cp400]|uniref:AbpD bacteriocin export accessory protein n=1 Tax=Ligilactobacillus salivarius cp400 TaxID=1273133 RepID=V6DMW7_9LACO|nr:AbpD bacteriocin export accessory protein [Ligilactobacillus salivarius cp400]
MEDKFLESSEFYSARFRNFSTMIIIPFTILLLAVVIFSFFGKKEITIQGAGTLEALGNNPVIQSTVNSPIEKII